MVSKKIVLFGGTFDPIHLGHTRVAAYTAEHIGAEKIVFIPAKRSPLKNFFPEANDSDRLEMISLAITDNKTFELSDYELKKAEPSYTLHTIRHFKADYGKDTTIYWLVGADSIDELPLWYGMPELIDECNLLVMYRAGYSPPNFEKFTTIWGQKRTEKLQRNIIKTPLIDISSTEIRKRISTGRDATEMLHPKVADYILKHGLYKSK